MEPYDLDELIAEFGGRYQDEGQTLASSVSTQLFHTMGLERHFSAQPEDNDFFKSVYATVDDVLQAFSIQFTPKGQATFQPIQQRLGEFKLEKLEKPDLFRKTYMGFLSQHGKDADRSTWGILEWLLRELYIPAANDTFIREVAYFGWQYNGTFAPTPTVNGTTLVRQLKSALTPNPANASMDGIRTQIARWAAADRTVSITVGAWSTDPATFCTQIENFVFNDAAKLLRTKCDLLFMSEVFARRYRAGRRAKYNLNFGQVEDLDLIEDTSIRISGEVDMEGSQNIWMTPMKNRVKPTRAKAQKLFDVQKIDRFVKYLGDWSFVLTFHVPEFIVHSEHDTDIDSAIITARYTEA